MRSCLFLLAVAVFLAPLGGGCHSASDEHAGHDAEPAPRASLDASVASPSDASPASSASSASSTAPPPAEPAGVDAGEADGGVHAALHEFCSGAFLADEERMQAKCSPADLAVTERMEHAAADLCTRDMTSALRRSRADFDVEAGKKCVEMLRQKHLAQTSEGDSLFQHYPCDRVVVGKQPVGQPCLFSVECKEGLACVGYKPGLDGTCQKPPAAKEACTRQPYGSIANEAASRVHHPASAPGAYCDGSMCQPRVPSGKACTRADVCAAGLSCVKGKCGGRGGSGSACAAPGDCAFGLWCDRGGDGGAGTCAAKRGDGQECTSPNACKGRCDMARRVPGARPGAPGKCAAVCGSG